MKIRIVVMSLIFVVAFMLAACSGDSTNENRQENRNAAPASDAEAKTDITKELNQAVVLLNKAKNELDKPAKEAEAQAKRLLGYPSFVIADFRDPRGLAARLQSDRELSTYLFDNFDPANRDILKKQQGDAEAL